MPVFKGIIASQGVSIAPLIRYIVKTVEDLDITYCEFSTREEIRLDVALEKYIELLSEIKKKAPESERELLEAYELMAQSLVDEAKDIVRSENICSELAVKRVYLKYRDSFRESGSSLIALREADLRSIASSLIKYLMGYTEGGGILDIRDKIIIAEDVTPTDMIKFAKEGVKGVVTLKGGVTSHAAIIARSNDIPYIIIPEIRLDDIKDGEIAVLDALDGLLVVKPGESELEKYMAKLTRFEELKSIIRRNAFIKATTLDNYIVDVLCNIRDLEEARVASSSGCDGVGLFRIEFLYMMKEKAPSEDVLYNTFIKVAEFFRDKVVVIRAPDLGADKPLPYLILKEDNPFLGLRGIRLLLEYREEIFKPFLRAFLRALRVYENLRLLLPMVTTTREVRETVELLNTLIGELRLDNKMLSSIKIGIMVETPAAALMIDKLVETGLIKFVSYGTNDLTQYTLAVDRGNVRVSYLYDELDPALLRLLEISVSKALEKGIEVEVCGEMASKIPAIPVLLGLGIRGLSVNPTQVGLVKYVISKLSVNSVKKELLSRVLSSSNNEESRRSIREYMVSIGLEELKPWL
ncbi:MAG: phosphoenolpyruvate--protein phosphotransferase [Desulfurococcaceae archaeon]|nr:phosphoenolpyruvate--protein phosphotransferase [Desulfurococcaceae archaeon]